jgi:putative endonuclease
LYLGAHVGSVRNHYVYVLRCADDTLYTGYTTDVDRRVAEHDAGEGAKYTRGRTPVELVHVEAFDSKSAALSREHEIKSMSRARKESLVDSAPTDGFLFGRGERDT